MNLIANFVQSSIFQKTKSICLSAHFGGLSTNTYSFNSYRKIGLSNWIPSRSFLYPLFLLFQFIQQKQHTNKYKYKEDIFIIALIPHHKKPHLFPFQICPFCYLALTPNHHHYRKWTFTFPAICTHHPDCLPVFSYISTWWWVVMALSSFDGLFFLARGGDGSDWRWWGWLVIIVRKYFSPNPNPLFLEQQFNFYGYSCKGVLFCCMCFVKVKKDTGKCFICFCFLS